MAKKKIITVTVRDKIAEGCKTKLVCDNSDYRIRFDLDSDWDGINAKTARLLFGTGHYDFPFTGNEVDIDKPIPPVRSVTIGIFAGDIKTSTPAFFECRPSVKSAQSKPAPEPPEDVYNKIMALIEGVDDAIRDVDELPTESIDSQCFYNVGGKLYYRVGDEWAEITTDFFEYVGRGEYDAAMQSLTDSLAEINEGVDGKLAEIGEDLKEIDNKAVEAHNKAVEVNTIANNALGISKITLENTRDFGERLNETDKAIETLQGTGEGSVVKAVADALAKLVADAPESLNTLKEISDWITEHADDASAMNSEILKLRDEIDNAIKSIDFSPYVKSTDYATEEKAGVIKVGSTTTDPLYAYDNGDLHLGNDNALIDQRSGENAIRNQDLDHAIKVGLTDNQLLLTEDDKKKIIAWLGLEAGQGQLGFAQYAYHGGEYGTTPFPGIVSYSQTLGIGVINNTTWRNTLAIAAANNAIIDKKADIYRAIVPARLDYAVMKALTDSITHEWTPEQKALAQKTLGVGEWIEATKETSDGYDYYFLSAKDNGVYEYVLYAINSNMMLNIHESGIIIYDKTVFDGESISIEDGKDYSDEYGQIYAHRNIGISSYSLFVDISFTKTSAAEHPSKVVLKARKIREI